ncbi:MAG: helix-hairpin-helix domain-containing protein, partial [Synergistaceae bacterium]|nr:helix-hairpin-helix domain-containing protein [Synergistaceae bacterium]
SLNLAEKIFSDGLHIHVFEKGEREAQEAKAAEKVRQARESVRESQVQPVNVRVPGVQVTQVSGARTQTQSQNSGLVDVNHASEQELTRLKGVGPAIAKRIVEFRKNMGSFKAPEDLLQVRGIGPKTLDKMRSQILIR